VTKTTKQQDGVLQDRCPDIVLAIGGRAVVFLTEIRAEAAAMQAQIAAGGRMESEVEVARD